MTYRRFDRSAEAIRFAIEELPEPMQRGVAMEIGDDRFEFADILELYKREQYPLARRPNVLAPVQRPATAVRQR